MNTTPKLLVVKHWMGVEQHIIPCQVMGMGNATHSCCDAIGWVLVGVDNGVCTLTCGLHIEATGRGSTVMASSQTLANHMCLPTTSQPFAER
jgi:hypothetical protein